MCRGIALEFEILVFFENIEWISISASREQRLSAASSRGQP